MSFRNTFITDFIYMASDEVKDAIEPLTDAFKRNVSVLDHTLDDRGYGYFSGRLDTTGGSIEEMQLPRLLHSLRETTKVPFRIVFLLESGAVIIECIEP